jgi:signal transduction histidine kinase/CheY-like chemotaxis protein
MGASSSFAIAWLLGVVSLILPARGQGQQSVSPKHILALYWYNKDYPGNAEFDKQFQAELRSGTQGRLEYYSEYLEENRFPGEHQSQFLRDFLRKKYAGRTIDVVVANTPPTLSFLNENRDVLFPRTPIVFATTDFPPDQERVSGPGATGIVYAMSYGETLDLALKLHPETEQVFIISGGLEQDPPSEGAARRELQSFEGKIGLNYLTNLPLADLIERVKSLPEKSLVLYGRQRARNQQGGVMESQDVLSLISRQASVPIYGLSYANVGLGIVGGYVWTSGANADKLAEITLRVANGTRAADIPFARAPAVPMFDWRQLQRWGIPEGRLPPGSVIRFRELTPWQTYRGRIIGASIVVALQALLIGALLVAQRRARRTRLELEQYKENLEQLVVKRTAELVEARDQAQAASKAKSAFLASMSHELRTPLNAILGFSNLLLQHGATEEQCRDLDIINRSGEHLLSLINDVLDLAKIEAGRAVIEIVPCDLKALLREVFWMIRPRAEEKLLVLRLVEAPESPRYIRADAGRLRQVLINLLGNAVKYTDKGSVTVRLGARPAEDEDHVRLVLEVEDTGIGIAAEDTDRIFEAFVQLAGARMQKGTGLGLAITRQIIELMGGTIQVQSTLGKGSCFRIELPVERTRESEGRTSKTEPEQVIGLEAGSPDYRVLIVEDERENQELLKHLLQGAGFQVRIAQDGAEGVDSFREWQPHFIWMDLRMPVMNGFDAARQIRALEGGREVKIAAVTASGFADQRKEALAAGMNDYLRKPYRPSEVFECMARLLGVQYQRKTIPFAGELAEELRPEDVAALPVDLRAALQEALLALNVERISAAIDRVSLENPSLGSALARCASQYAYTAMLNVVQLDRSQSPGGRNER